MKANQKERERVIIFYDYDCSFCKKVCITIKKYLLLYHAQILPITSNPHAMKIFREEYSWAVYDGTTDMYYSKSSAWWRLVKISPFSFFFYCVYIPGVRWLGDRVYDVVARSRTKTCAV